MGTKKFEAAVVITGVLLILGTLQLPRLYAQTIDNMYIEANHQGVPKTGQETCYNTTNVSVTCNATWAQDAYYADPAGVYDIGYTRGEGSWANWNADGGRFINNTDGTVTDRTTGLMWVANSTAAGRGGMYTWWDAINASENLTYAGHDDWRLPNVRELQSIVDYGTSSPAIDTNFFVAQSNYYWSSTTYKDNPSVAWYVFFVDGYMYCNSKTTTLYVRPVRGGQ